MIKKTDIIEPETGEIVHSKTSDLFAVFDEQKGYLFWSRKAFSRSFSSIDYPVGISVSDIGRLTLLSKRIWANTNMIGYRGNGGVRPMTIKHMGGVIGLGGYQAGVFIRKMIRLGIMARVDVNSAGLQESQYYINPIYFCSTNRIPLNLYLIFREQLDNYLPNWVKQKYNNVQISSKDIV